VNLADADYISSANEQMFVVAFLEHVSALESLDEIMEVEGIHAYYVGPQDMSVSMGLGGQPDHPKIKEASDMVQKAAEARGRKYLGPDVFVADRASNFFLNGISAFMETHKDKLG
jgi:2-keto-3-deoxy-L-rhamnonate aldolase RhmA